MLSTIYAIIIIFLTLLFIEYLYRRNYIGKESGRKIVHITSGLIVAFLPYFTEYIYIKLLAAAFFAVILISLRFKIFRSVHAVKRVTAGEILYAAGIGVCAFLEPSTWIFTVAILHLALADALAALIGLKFGKKTFYKVFGHRKSVYGSVTFAVVSALIFTGAIIWAPVPHFSAEYLLITLPLILTIIENFSWWGIDNLTIPLAVVVLLSNF